MKILFCISLLLLSFCGDSKKSYPIKIRNVQLSDSVMQPGRVRGINRDFSEFFLVDEIDGRKDKQIWVKIVNTDTQEVKSIMKLTEGDVASPQEISTIGSVKPLNDKYLICDGYNKIVMLNNQFEFFSSNRLKKKWHFIDYFEKDEKIYIIVGEEIITNSANNTSRIYKVLFYSLIKDKLPTELLIIKEFKSDFSNIIVARRDGNFLNKYYFTPSLSGFIKDRKCYYSFNRENKYYIYDFTTKQEREIVLHHLTEKTYSKEEAIKVGTYKSGDADKKLKKVGLDVHHLPYHKPIYFLRMLDVGENLLGIITDINFEKMEFRLDILSADSGKYLETCFLPAGKDFLNGISVFGPGFRPIFIHYKKGIYIWGDREGEDLKKVVKTTKFSLE
jgi:hypothetical protein